MLDLDAVTTFVMVTRLGSFSAAGRALRLPRSTVSQRVARLEAALGVRLLERTTRVVRATRAGAAYQQRCSKVLADLEAATDAARELESEPRGTLRVATPVLFGQPFLTADRSALRGVAHPGVQIELVATRAVASVPIEALPSMWR